MNTWSYLFTRVVLLNAITLVLLGCNNTAEFVPDKDAEGFLNGNQKVIVVTTDPSKNNGQVCGYKLAISSTADNCNGEIPNCGATDQSKNCQCMKDGNRITWQRDDGEAFQISWDADQIPPFKGKCNTASPLTSSVQGGTNRKQTEQITCQIDKKLNAGETFEFIYNVEIQGCGPFDPKIVIRR